MTIEDWLRSIQPGKGGECQLTDAIANLLKSGQRVIGVSVLPNERRYDVGNFETYFKAFIEMALNDPELKDDLRTYVEKILVPSAQRKQATS